MGLGNFISKYITDSKNKFQAQQAQTDPNAYQYGGAPGGADEAANRYKNTAEWAQTRQAAQADFSGAQPDFSKAQANYGQADADRAMQMQARQGQSSLAQAMQARAMGQTPSIAGMQSAEDIRRIQQGAANQSQQSMAQQGAQAASARGAAGVALAGQNAANNVANANAAIGQGAAQASQNVANQAQINAANERMQAENAAFGAYSGMRGGDVASQQQSAQQAQFGAQLGTQQQQFNAQLGTQQRQFNAGLEMQQRGLNDTMSQSMTQNEMGVRNSQLTAGMNQQAQNSANFNAAQGINAGIAAQNAQSNERGAMGALGAIGSLAGGIAMMSDERVKTKATPFADFVTSTWGSGRGVSPEDINEQDAVSNNRLANVMRRDRERDARIEMPSGTAGGFALPGLSPGVRDPNDQSKYMTPVQPLQQRDQETIGLAKAKQAEGAELSDEEERKLGGAHLREGNDKKATAAQRIGSGLSKFGDSLTKTASSVDSGYHPTNTYMAPQLIPLQSGIEMKTGLRPLSTRGINPTGDGYMTSDERAKREAFEAGAQVAAKHFTGDDYTWGENGPELVPEPKQWVAPTGPNPLPPVDPNRWVPKKQPGPDEAVQFAAKRPVERAPERVPEMRPMSVPEQYQWERLMQSAPFDETQARAFLPPQESPEPVPGRKSVGGTYRPAQRSRVTTSDERAKNIDRGPLANAARSMAGSEYEYKGPFTPPDQEPGEKNVGPMANNMAKDPVASNIVKRDPSIGLPGGGLVLDQGKMVKTLGAIVADLQRQQDEDRTKIATLSSRMRRKP